MQCACLFFCLPPLLLLPLAHAPTRALSHFPCSYNIETIPGTRTYFDATVGARDLWETYLPVFEACVQEGHGQSVMCS
jgi:hypothetical protein